MAKTSEKAPHRPRAHGHRYADAVKVGGDLVAVGVRYDEDAPDTGESLVVRLRPGRVEPLGHCDGVARALVVAHGAPHVLLADGRLVRLDGDTTVPLRADVIDIVDVGDDVLVLDAAGTVTTLGAPSTVLGSLPGGTRLASDGARVVVATENGVFDIDGTRVVDRGGNAVAVAGSRVAVVHEKSLVVVDGAGRPTVFSVSHELHSVACFAGRVFVGSRAAGLFVLVDGDDRVRPLRPSLRGRTLRVAGGALAVASDLLVATSDDGEDFDARDLAGFVRLAEKMAHGATAQERGR
jgi:hypothetical protein